MARRPTLRRTPGLESLESRCLLSAAAPDDQQMYALWLLNQSRTNPKAAAVHYTTNLDSSTRATIDFYGVNLPQVASKIATTPAQPPLAWNPSLADAAQQHSQDMADHNFQSHSGSDGSDPGGRARKSGYNGAV